MDEFKDAIAVSKLIGAMFAPHLEVVFHDLTQTHYPIIAIVNAHITGRKPGDTSALFNRLDFDTDQIVNYEFEWNGKTLKSSSIILKASDGTPALGISFNFDSFPMEQFRLYLDSFFNDPARKKSLMSEKTTDLKNTLHKTLLSLNLGLKSLNRDEILVVLKALHEQGLLQKHGMMSLLSKEFKLTRKTLYDYRNRLFD